MLNLKELEEALDNALANETPESLNSWLDQVRSRKIEGFIGESECIDIPDLSLHSVEITSVTQMVIPSQNSDTNSDTMYLAA